MKTLVKKTTSKRKTVASRSSNAILRQHARAVAKKFGPVFDKLRKE